MKEESKSKLSLGLAALGLGAAGYEAFAIVTDDAPTISEVVWFLPDWLALVIFSVLVLIGLDHFITRRYL